jgi:hypothetical protein
MPEPKEPQWLSATTKHLNDEVKEYKSHLRDIAIVLARRERSETVNLRHVEEAFGAAARIGLRRNPWWQRTELESTVGGLLVGFTFILPDVVGFFWPDDSSTRTGVVSGIMVASFLIGAVAAVHAWFRGKLPL